MLTGVGDCYDLAKELLVIPGMIRGYGHVKDKSLRIANERREAILKRVHAMLEPEQSLNRALTEP